jgi:hypothetical protein
MSGGKSGHSRHTSCLWSSIDISLSAAAAGQFECEFEGEEGSSSIRHVEHQEREGGREVGRDGVAGRQPGLRTCGEDPESLDQDPDKGKPVARRLRGLVRDIREFWFVVTRPPHTLSRESTDEGRARWKGDPNYPPRK